jgi:uncharacterized protein (TIGR02246 family)
MRIAALVVVSLLLLNGSSVSPAAQTPAKGSPTAAIHAIADAYVQASLKGDAKALAALYTDDALEMPPNAPIVKGKPAIEQYYQKLFGSGMKVTTFSLSHIETQAVGDNAYDVGTYRQNLTPPNATAGTDTGKYTVILKRSGGAWKVAYAIYNSDLPPQR